MLKRILRHWKGGTVFLAVFILGQVFRARSGGGSILDLIYSLRDLCASALFGLAVDIYDLRAEIRLLMADRNSVQEMIRLPAREFMHSAIVDAMQARAQLASESGALLSSNTLSELIAGAYKAHGNGHCVVLQVWLPSDFDKVFPGYATEHFWKGRKEDSGRDVRVLINSVDKLIEDQKNNENSFWTFYEVNMTHSTEILQIDIGEAQKALNSIPAQNAWIYGPEYAIFCNPEDGSDGDAKYRVFLRPIDHYLGRTLRNVLKVLVLNSNKVVMQDKSSVRILKMGIVNKRTCEDNIVWGIRQNGHA